MKTKILRKRKSCTFKNLKIWWTYSRPWSRIELLSEITNVQKTLVNLNHRYKITKSGGNCSFCTPEMTWGWFAILKEQRKDLKTALPLLLGGRLNLKTAKSVIRKVKSHTAIVWQIAQQGTMTARWTNAMYKHSKSWISWIERSAESLNFPQKDCLGTQKLAILQDAFLCIFMPF